MVGLLEERGGPVPLAEVIGELATRFGCRESTVRAYASAPRFVLDGDGLRLRRENEPYRVGADLAAAGADRVGEDVAAITVEVDGEHLRGSGTPFPAELAGWLGVVPGARRSFAASSPDRHGLFDGSETSREAIEIYWSDLSHVGPAIGSLRDLLIGAGLGAGAAVRLTFDRAAGTLSLAAAPPRGAAGVRPRRARKTPAGPQGPAGAVRVLRTGFEPVSPP